MILTETLPGGAMWSMRVPCHRTIRLKALAPGANLSALFFHADNPIDRLNLPDTLKALHTAKLTAGHVLMSDMGHALVSITEDTLGWHDPLAGFITPEIVRTSFGEGTYQDYRNNFLRNSHDNFLVELAKHDLGIRDLVATINFFSKVTADDDGGLHFDPSHCKVGESITLRAEVNLLAVFSNCPHPMHPPGDYPCVPVEITVAPGIPAASDDFCRNFRPECTRAMELTERLYI